jgi:RNA recognition motif-containing protein
LKSHLINVVCHSGSAASKQELEESFSYYGPLRNVWVARNPPGFAFVEYEDPRDAEDAVRGLDGRYVLLSVCFVSDTSERYDCRDFCLTTWL